MPEISALQDFSNPADLLSSTLKNSLPFERFSKLPPPAEKHIDVNGSTLTAKSSDILSSHLTDNQTQIHLAAQLDQQTGDRFKGRIIDDQF